MPTYEYKSKLQNNLNWGETFNMGRKAPAVSKRIFMTLADAQAFVDNVSDSATEGIRITVLNDPSVEKNGLYYVKRIGNGDVDGEMVQLGRGSAAWYKGNAISGTESTEMIPGATPGDCYLNSDNLNIYVLQPDGKWTLVGNLTAQKVDRTAPYYILSDNGQVHPEFDLDTWTKGNADGTNIPSDYSSFNSGQVYLWTRMYDDASTELIAKYTVALVYSTLNLGTFTV